MISKVLSIPYLDMDEEIEQENKTIKEIFEKMENRILEIKAPFLNL